MKKTKISKKVARDKYGIITTGVNSMYDYFLLENGNVIDDEGDIRYTKPQISPLQEAINELEIAKKNVQTLLDEPESLIDMHSIKYWAGEVERLRELIKNSL
jgi:hypothetical protein